MAAEESLVPAIAEAAERHAASVFYEGQFLWASADCIDRPVLDLDTVACCSETERSDPHCSLGLPTKSEPIRWVEGISLHEGSPVLIPAVMVYSHAGWRAPQERFWLSISTGCAAHQNYEEALLTGISEVVERDAIALIWRQRMSIPAIIVDEPGPELAPYWALYQGGSADVEYRFFDATLDMALPTVYGIQISRHHPYAYTTVACATARTYDEAICKVIKDFVSFKRAFGKARKLPENVRAFTGLLDGAAYMAARDRADAFTFLLETPRVQMLSALRAESTSPQSLSSVLDRLKQLQMDVFAVDLTTDEAHRAGLKVVRVVIPSLQPFSLHVAAQYLAHPRLYAAPVQMGYVAYDEPNLSPWPQPFA